MPHEDPPQRELTPVPPVFAGWDPIAAILAVVFWLWIASSLYWVFTPLNDFSGDRDLREAACWDRATILAIGAWMLGVAFLIARLKPRPEPHSITGGKPPDPT